MTGVAPNKGLSASKIISCVFHGFVLVLGSALRSNRRWLKTLRIHSIRKELENQPMIERPISRTQHSSETRSCACLACLVPSYLFLGKSVLLVELILLYCLRISFWQNLKFSIKRNELQICSRFGAHIIRGRLFFCLFTFYFFRSFIVAEVKELLSFAFTLILCP